MTEGNCSVVRIDESIDELELGWCMGRQWWGKGLMPEAARAVIDLMFHTVGAKRVIHLPTSPGAEDFAYYEKEKPGLLFGLGLRNEAKGAVYPAHTKDWDIDEDGLSTGVKVFVQFVLDNMGGIEGVPAKEG